MKVFLLGTIIVAYVLSGAYFETRGIFSTYAEAAGFGLAFGGVFMFVLLKA